MTSNKLHPRPRATSLCIELALPLHLTRCIKLRYEHDSRTTSDNKATKPVLGEGMLHWPTLLFPQATIVPSSLRPRLWKSPAAIATKPVLGEIAYFKKLKAAIGDIHGHIHSLAVRAAKIYLMEKHPLSKSWQVSEKYGGGIDIVGSGDDGTIIFKTPSIVPCCPEVNNGGSD